MQATPTFETVLRQIKQMSLTDQFRLLEWLVNQLKSTLLSPATEKMSLPLSIAELEQKQIAGYQRHPQQSEEIAMWLDEQVWEE